MSFGKVQSEDQHLKIEYSAPLFGLDTSALAPYIQGMAGVNNVILRNNTYIPAVWTQTTFGDQNTFNTTSNFYGIGELPFPAPDGSPAEDISDKVFYVEMTTAANAVGHVSDALFDPFTNVGTVAMLAGVPLGSMTYKSINQTTYVSGDGMAQILQFQIGAGGTVTMTELTNQLGCKFLGELNGRLVALNVLNYAAGPPIVITNYPYRIAWSAGGEQYGVWNALDLSGNPTGAGYNNLPDVEDVITGAVFIGPTAYIFRVQGITEMTSLNSGIQPFNFDHMWASRKGVGSAYPDSIAQYGAKAVFVSTTDIYTIGLEGISVIGGPIKRALYADLINSTSIRGCLCSMTINDCPELCYVLAMQLSTLIKTYIYGFETRQWTVLIMDNSSLSELVQNTTMLTANIIQQALPDSVSFDSSLIVRQKSFQAPTFWFVPPYPLNSTGITGLTPTSLIFPIERIVMWKNVTIDAISVYAQAASAGATIRPSVNGVAFTDVIIGTDADLDDDDLYSSYPVSGVAVTTHNPQLTVLIDGQAEVAEVTMYGSIGPGRGI